MLEVTRKTLMITAAVASIRWVPRMRPTGCCSSSPPGPARRAPSTWVITATPVSKPDMPSASFGNTRSETATIIAGLPYSAFNAWVQSVTTWGWVATWASATAMTIVFSSR